MLCTEHDLRFCYGPALNGSTVHNVAYITFLELAEADLELGLE